MAKYVLKLGFLTGGPKGSENNYLKVTGIAESFGTVGVTTHVTHETCISLVIDYKFIKS